MIPLLFGETSAGLRQKCLRKILESVLFQNQPGKIAFCFHCWFEINRDGPSLQQESWQLL